MWGAYTVILTNLSKDYIPSHSFIIICIYLQAHKDNLPLSRDQPLPLTVETLDQAPTMLIENTSDIVVPSDIPFSVSILNNDADSNKASDLKVIDDFIERNYPGIPRSNILIPILEGK